MTDKLNTAKMEDKAMSLIVPKCCGEGIKLENTIKYRETNECVSFFNTNGAIIKNQKLMLLQIFSCTDIQQSQLEQYLTEVDMEFIWRLCMPPSEEREKYDKTECALRDYTKKIFNTVISRHGKAKSIFLIDDPFD